MSRRGPLALELRVELPHGLARRRRLGTIATLGALAALLATVVAALLGVAALPSLVVASRVRREMNVSLERRAALGERLHALVGEYSTLHRLAREHAARVDRIRALYGLPELAPRTVREPASRGASSTAIFAAAILHGQRLDAEIEATLARTDALLATLADWERERPETVRAVPALLPVAAAEAVPVSGFGPRRDPVTGETEFHAGFDVAAPLGATIRAPADAVVRWTGDAPTGAGERWWRLGRLVVLTHGSTYTTLFGHCDRVLVRVGQRVAAGAPIATVGRTGWTPMPKLHYEVRRREADGDWRAVDPVSLALDPAFAAAAAPAGQERGPGEPMPPPLPRAFAR